VDRGHLPDWKDWGGLNMMVIDKQPSAVAHVSVGAYSASETGRLLA